MPVLFFQVIELCVVLLFIFPATRLGLVFSTPLQMGARQRQQNKFSYLLTLRSPWQAWTSRIPSTQKQGENIVALHLRHPKTEGDRGSFPPSPCCWWMSL